MRVLVIGGSYFLGRAFVIQLLQDKWSKRPGQVEIILLNRGTRPSPDGVDKVYKFDRHNAEGLSQCRLKGSHFDAVVDFCAYNSGDIEGLVSGLGITFTQYIFISTCDVYERFTGKELDEDSAFETREFPGEEGAYITGKVHLEKELVKVCEKAGSHYTSIRPAMIYGPGNYAPREGIYFNWIAKAGQILQPFNATGYFQLVYVEDVAKAIFLVCGNKACFDKAYNVGGIELQSYFTFRSALLRAVPVKFHTVYMTVEEIAKKNIDLPFPLLEEESETYLGERIVELGLDYTELSQGLKKSWDYFIETEAQ
ncbi:MAG: NAD-dependent epimerase/dehydratase family protein [Lachnospiraceae bacterium]|nr:NAD-dependent epimerase/dehydratase family protein [Lachnospiraceae bacterium]